MNMTLKTKVIIGAISLVIVLSLTIPLMAKHGSLTPSETIHAFHEQATKGEIEKSKNYISEQVLKQFDKGSNWWMGSYPTFIKEYNEDFQSVKPLEDTEEINGKMATIDVRITSPEGVKHTEPYILVKENGEWKITYDY
jgi:Domain of unknown function (DUF4878)